MKEEEEEEEEEGLSFLLPEDDALQVEGVLDDSRRGDAHPEHILLGGEIADSKYNREAFRPALHLLMQRASAPPRRFRGRADPRGSQRREGFTARSSWREQTGVNMPPCQHRAGPRIPAVGREAALPVPWGRR
ncbi:hypothetical protein EYF80_022764 [Liparis tanakae]|uniref:Uncharacterized protein n=1 Tax=Liparis tanakae TaxID=230148 RepID=A0A4Z2HN71_9TELE|nr:hypothetical protein EYF80_022764 [Liparis tanakae]